MFATSIVKREIKLKSVNVKQDLFCKIFALDPNCLGNGSYAYQKAYGSKSAAVAGTGSKQLLKKPEITARINEYLQQDGFNNENVDKQHLFLINQFKDLNVKMKGIEHYNRLTKRIDNKIEIIIPKPLMELDEDEVIHKIDKKKVRDVGQESSNDV